MESGQSVDQRPSLYCSPARLSPLSAAAAANSATYEYDDAGNPDNNLTSLEIGTGLLEVTTLTGSDSPVTTYFLVDTQTQTGYAQVVEQSTTPGTPTVSYVWGLNLIAQNNAAGTPNAGTYYFVVDGHGSTVALINASGNVVQTFHYDGFGNALGFTPSTAITQYLYTQQYYDLASSTYYDWGRNYDPATGMFDQADYGYSGSLADPMSYLPYAFTGGDPVNMLDLNGHDFSLTDTIASLAINSVLTSAISEAATPFLGYVAAALIPSFLTTALLTAGSPDAIEFGVNAVGMINFAGVGLGGTGGGELVISPHNGNAALYAFAGGALTFGSIGRFSAGGAVSAGLVWNSSTSADYTGSFRTISVPFLALSAGLRTAFARQLAQDFVAPKLFELPGITEPGFISYSIYNANYAREAAIMATKIANGLSTSVNLFYSPSGSHSFGISFGLGLQTGGPSGNSVSFAFTDYWQLLPNNMSLSFA